MGILVYLFVHFVEPTNVFRCASLGLTAAGAASIVGDVAVRHARDPGEHVR